MTVQFAFISRHAPTPEQHALAEAKNIKLVHIGDLDAFSVTPFMVDTRGDFIGVVVVHPAAALRLASNFEVGVFENAERAEPGDWPTFYAKALHIYRVWEM